MAEKIFRYGTEEYNPQFSTAAEPKEEMSATINYIAGKQK